MKTVIDFPLDLGDMDTVPTVDQLLRIPVEDNGESLVEVEAQDDLILSFHNSGETAEEIGEVMLLRASVAQRLKQAASILADQSPKLESGEARYVLRLYYAYRLPRVQKAYFDSAMEQARREFPDDLDAQLVRAQTLAARPDVAGHPAGAAVDVDLWDRFKGAPADMGVARVREAYRAATPEEIRPDCMTIPEEARQERWLLRRVMMQAGFAPFNGEFWHFSYGDREWAEFTGEDKAVYGEVLTA